MNEENTDLENVETHTSLGDTSAEAPEDFMTFTITNEDREKYKRLDQFLAESADGYSRTFLKNLFLKEQICVADESTNPDLKLELKKMPPVGTIINILVPPLLPSTALPEDIPLEILFQDEHLVVVNKPAGLVTHPAPGNYTGTLVNAILFHCKDIQGVGDQKRPGIVHRLDKGTSGVMVIAKTQAAHEGLVLLFSTHDIERYYEALVMRNRCQSYGTIEHPIARDPSNRLKMKAFTSRGKRAVTNYKVLDVFEKHVHMEFKLETGRTHQIRVHTADVLKMPIICDYAYGSPNEQYMKLGADYKELINGYQYPFLHAKVLGFVHPITNARIRFEVPPPPIFQKLLAYSKLKNDDLNDL